MDVASYGFRVAKAPHCPRSRAFATRNPKPATLGGEPMKQTMIAVMLLLAAGALFADELAVGAKAPGFTLTNAVDGKAVTFRPGEGKISAVGFTSNQGTYAKA